MNVITIQNLCNYLEELGIVDQKSITPFLSLYSMAINNYIINNDTETEDFNSKLESNIAIFENVLCSYLKKIFNIEKNYKTFSHKIIDKFKQNILIKQYNGLFLLIYIFSKKIKYSVIKSFYSIKQYIINRDESTSSIYQNNNIKPNHNKKEKDINNDFLSYNDEICYNKYYINENEKNNSIRKNIFLKYINEYNKETINDNNTLKNMANCRNESNFNNFSKKSKSLNNSINRMKRLLVSKQSKHTKNKRINKRIGNSNYNNIQFENKKNQFLSKIKKEHSINFKKKKDIFNNPNISKIFPIKNKESSSINYMDYNSPSSQKNNDDSLYLNECDMDGNDYDNNNKKNNIYFSCYNSYNNYDNEYNIYHLNKSRSTLDNNYTRNLNKYRMKEFYNDDNYKVNNDDEVPDKNYKHHKKNMVFNQNYIGIKNLKYKCKKKNDINTFDDNYFDDNNSNKNINVDAFTSNESIFN